MNGCDINVANSIGVTPLHLAAKCTYMFCSYYFEDGFVNAVRLLVALGADLTKTCTSGCTAEDFVKRGSAAWQVPNLAKKVF